MQSPNITCLELTANCKNGSSVFELPELLDFAMVPTEVNAVSWKKNPDKISINSEFT